MQSAGVASGMGDPVEGVGSHAAAIVALVVAMAENRVIGRLGGLPWTLPSDLKTFRRITLGKPVIMGRKTFDSIGRPLDGRTNIVVTRRTDVTAPGIVTVATVPDAVEHGRRAAGDTGVGEVMVIGGAEIYLQSLPIASRIYLTLVHASPDGDTHFPPLDGSWREVAREPLLQTARDQYAATLTVLERSAHIDPC
jgi:dihydrofolate reductase